MSDLISFLFVCMKENISLFKYFEEGHIYFKRCF